MHQLIKLGPEKSSAVTSNNLMSSPLARYRPSHQTGPFHDGDAAGDGLQRPAAQPAATEEARLQPAAHGQRAGADGRGAAEQCCQLTALSDRTGDY